MLALINIWVHLFWPKLLLVLSRWCRVLVVIVRLSFSPRQSHQNKLCFSLFKDKHKMSYRYGQRRNCLQKEKAIKEKRTKSIKCHLSENLEQKSFLSQLQALFLHSLVKTEANVWENSRADQWKPEMQSRVFTCSRILTNFAVLTMRKTIYKACMYTLISLMKL